MTRRQERGSDYGGRFWSRTRASSSTGLEDSRDPGAVVVGERGPAGICRIADCFADSGATARCLVCATDGSAEVFGEGVVQGTIAAEPRGRSGFGWDSSFIPDDGDGRTYGEMTEDEKNLISHRRKAFLALRDALHGD